MVGRHQKSGRQLVEWSGRSKCWMLTAVGRLKKVGLMSDRGSEISGKRRAYDTRNIWHKIFSCKEQ